MNWRIRTGWLLLAIVLSVYSAAVIAASDELPTWPAWLLMGVAGFVGAEVGDRIDKARDRSPREGVTR